MCSCTTTKNITTKALPNGQNTEYKIKIPIENQIREYEPSGKSEYINNELISENYLAEANIFDSITEYIVMHTSSENNSAKVDTVITKNVELTELKEANQSFTLGLISFSALIASIFFIIPGLLYFSVILFIASFVLGILGLRRGITAKSIMTNNNYINPNAKKANWGIILSLAIFASILALLALFIYLTVTYFGF